MSILNGAEPRADDEGDSDTDSMEAENFDSMDAGQGAGRRQ